jgi:hypothetical protein
MIREWGTIEREEKCVQFLAGKPEGDCLEDPDVGGRIILKWILRE